MRVVGAAESRRLNARYRGKDRPTNVLSFPPPPLPARGSATITSRREGADYSARPGLRPSGAAKRGSARRSTKAQGALLNADRRARRAEAQDAPSKSLPTIWSRPLGDLVICAQVVRSEARLQRKPLQAHWAHLIVHGALHLVGYDHERESDAKRMERREIAVLRRLGFANPYRV
ncbi:MAG: rRNA maturation RNase YbeY [Steroidobacteraceae bacterium]